MNWSCRQGLEVEYMNRIAWRRLRIQTLAVCLIYCFTKGSFAMSFIIESPAFSANSMIPAEYTCQGANISPPLQWSPGPEGTQSYVLIVDDPDAPMGVWDHWVLFNIPFQVTQLPQGSPTPQGASDGVNSWGTKGYRGPCPPGGTHRYAFKIYALNTILQTGAGASTSDIERAMDGHILSSSMLIGLYRQY